MEISRRRFFKLAGAAGAALALPGAVGVGAGIKALVEEPRGAWMFADGSWLPEAEFPELFEIIGHAYGLPRQPVDAFRLPDLTARVELAPLPDRGPYNPSWGHEARVVREFNHIIKVRPGGDDSIPVGTLLAYVGSELPA